MYLLNRIEIALHCIVIGVNRITLHPYLLQILSIINVLYRWPLIASASVMEMHNSNVFGGSYGIHVFYLFYFSYFILVSQFIWTVHLGIWKVHVLCINHVHQAEVFV